jgi:hypothetical protein
MIKHLLLAVVVVVGGAACRRKPRTFNQRYFARWDATQLLCSQGADRTHEWPLDRMRASIDLAAARGWVVQTYGHGPTFDVDEWLPLIAYAADHGVPMLTYRDLAEGAPRAGWAFSIDDDEIDVWYTWRDRLRAAHARFTFFVSKYATFTADQKRKLRELAADGHDVEAHGRTHVDATEYAAAHGADAYLRDEALPSRDALIADGYPVTTFAYPYGARDAALDAALAPHFRKLRSVRRWCFGEPAQPGHADLPP